MGNASYKTGRILEDHDLQDNDLTGRLPRKVERRTREHNVSGHYRLWVRLLGWPTKKLLIVFRMRR